MGDQKLVRRGSKGSKRKSKRIIVTHRGGRNFKKWTVRSVT